MRALKRITVRSVLPANLEPLEGLALNLQWSWNPATARLFASIDPELWEQSQDPILLLGEVSSERLEELARDAGFVNWVNERKSDLDAYLATPGWFQNQQGTASAAITGIAYFSPEFGVTAALPQYSGGLGILAGDHLKSSSDLGVPLIGIGLFYKSGYFRQSLSRDGWQVEHYPISNPDASPVTLLRERDGSPVRITVGMPQGRELGAHVWIAQVGRVPLILLDSDIGSNEQDARDVTDRLYGGGSDNRLEQEMLLGIGGIRALRRYCELNDVVSPNVFHTNEGHAGFLGLERMRELVQGPVQLNFEQALEATRANTVFTTHTPVPAGIDRFSIELISRYFGGDNADPGMPVEKIIALGKETDADVFNMAMMGFRLAGRANGVSLLHGEVSREMFAHLWPGFDIDDVPITSITNGVHAPTWVAPQIFELAQQEFGFIEPDHVWDRMGELSDEKFWAVKRELRSELITMARKRLRQSWRDRGAGESELAWTRDILDPDILTIGFARRVPSYKRLTLMLRDPQRLRALLTDPERPIQLVIAGKAHPADDGGKALIQQLVKFADAEDVRHRIVFLPNYEIGMATTLYPGCDVWLNNPIRPLEASGTSGMKAALNGALNLSIMDGWWDEWFDGQNGWAIPSANGVNDLELRDDLEAKALYDLIETQVAPTFYRVGESGVPHDWLAMIRHTLCELGPKVLATRMVRDYVQRLYTPAALAGNALCGDDFAPAKDLAEWKAGVREHWDSVVIEHVDADLPDGVASLGTSVPIRAYVNLGQIAEQDVNVQVIYGRVNSEDELEHPLHADLELTQSLEGQRRIYSGQIPLDRNGSLGYSVRITPTHPALASSADLGLQVVPANSEQKTDSEFPLR